MRRIAFAFLVAALVLAGCHGHAHHRHGYDHGSPAVVNEPPSDHGYFEYYNGEKHGDYGRHHHEYGSSH